MIRASDFQKGKDAKTALKRLLWERDMLMDMIIYGRDDFGPCWGIHTYEEDLQKGVYDDFCDRRRDNGECQCSKYDALCVAHWLETCFGEETPDFQDYSFGRVNSIEELVK